MGNVKKESIESTSMVTNPNIDNVNEFSLGKLDFVRTSPTELVAVCGFQFYEDPIVQFVKKEGKRLMQSSKSTYNLVLGSRDVNHFCICTKKLLASEMAESFQFGSDEGETAEAVEAIKRLESVIKMRPYFATESCLFCEVMEDIDWDSDAVEDAILDACEFMAPEAISDLDPVDFGRKHREIRFSYSP